MDFVNTILIGDCLERLKELPDNSVNCCVTSPPYYGLRDYGQDGQLGLEATPVEYVNKIVQIFSEVWRVLKDDGTLWLNLGDTYSSHKDCKSIPDTLRVGGKSETANIIEKGKSHSRNTKMLKSQGLKNKDLIGIPWMVAFALRADGWYLRQDIIWAKPNPMPESVTDRCTKSHEYVFLMSKSQKYYYDADAIKTESIEPEDDRGSRGSRKRVPTKLINGIRDSGVYPMANKRSVWTVNTKPYNESHFATFPERLIVDMIKAGCPEGGVVLDPFAGSGTTLLVARKLNRNYVGIELNPDYVSMAENRIRDEIGLFI